MSTKDPAVVLGKINEMMTRVKAVAREKERAVGSLIESAESTHDKVLQKLNDYINELEAERVTLQVEYDKYVAENEGLTEKLDNAITEKKIIESKRDILEDENKGLMKAVNDLRAETERQTGQISELTNKTQELTNDLSRLADEKSVLAAESDKRKKQLEGELAQKKTENKELKSRVDSLEAELQGLKLDMDRQRNDSKKERNELQAELEAAVNGKKNAEARAQKIQEAWNRMEE